MNLLHDSTGKKSSEEYLNSVVVSAVNVLQVTWGRCIPVKLRLNIKKRKSKNSRVFT